MGPTQPCSERGPRTQIIDLAGKTVLPGLIDSHVHPFGGLERVPGTSAASRFVRRGRSYIRTQAAKTPKGDGSWCRAPSPRG